MNMIVLDDNNKTKNMESNSISAKRPNIVSILCGYFLVAWSMEVINFVVSVLYKSITMEMIREVVKDQMFLIYIALMAVSLVGVIGIWMMRSWGVLTFAVATAGLLVFTLMQNTFSYTYLGAIIITFLPNITLAIAGFLSWDRVS